jgi:predicted SAM-dependent methyltransferase
MRNERVTSICGQLKTTDWPSSDWKCTLRAIDAGLARRFLSRRVPATGELPRLLNLGCGPVRYKDWVNADFYTFSWMMRGHAPPDWSLDATQPWKCPSDYWDGIFTEHVLEHLSYGGGLFAIGECYRTLKPGAWLRVSVPDINRFIDFQSFAGRFPRRPIAISVATQHFGHRSVWDPDLMTEVLSECGFVRAQNTGFRRGSDERLIMDQEARRAESLYVEAQKPSGKVDPAGGEKSTANLACSA